MRHKYQTEALVLHRIPVGESSMLLGIVTPELGFFYAKAQAVRARGAKLAHALQTLSRAKVTVTRGTLGWRLSGAVLIERAPALSSQSARMALNHTLTLFHSLAHGEVHDERLFFLLKNYLKALSSAPVAEIDVLEYASALSLLYIFGFLSKLPFPLADAYTKESGTYIQENKTELTKEINRGIYAANA